MVAVITGTVAGLGVGVGTLLLLLGIRGIEPVRPAPRLATAAIPFQRVAPRVAAAVLAGTVAFLGTGWVAGAGLVAMATVTLPGTLKQKDAMRAQVDKTEAVASWAEMLRDTMAAAAGIEEAITSTAPLAPRPIREAVERLAVRIERDRLLPALRAFADDVSDPAADLVVAALALASQRQAREIGNLLGALARAARAEATMRLRIDAGRARSRTAVRVVTITTLGFALLLIVFSRDFLTPYDDALGQAWLLVVGMIFSAAIWQLQRMARVAGFDRLLAGAATQREVR